MTEKRDPKQVEIAAAAKLYFRIAGYLWRDSYYNDASHIASVEVGLGLTELANWVGEKEKVVAGVLLTNPLMFEDVPGRFGNRKIWRLTRHGLVMSAKRYGAREPISNNKGEIWLSYPELSKRIAREWFDSEGEE